MPRPAGQPISALGKRCIVGIQVGRQMQQSQADKDDLSDVSIDMPGLPQSVRACPLRLCRLPVGHPHGVWGERADLAACPRFRVLAVAHPRGGAGVASPATSAMKTLIIRRQSPSAEGLRGDQRGDHCRRRPRGPGAPGREGNAGRLLQGAAAPWQRRGRASTNSSRSCAAATRRPPGSGRSSIETGTTTGIATESDDGGLTGGTGLPTSGRSARGEVEQSGGAGDGALAAAGGAALPALASWRLEYYRRAAEWVAKRLPGAAVPLGRERQHQTGAPGGGSRGGPKPQ